jgi:Ribosomal protein S9
MAQEQTYATGRRKTAIARVWITPGSGKVAINKMELSEYFGNIFFEPKVASLLPSLKPSISTIFRPR